MRQYLGFKQLTALAQRLCAKLDFRAPSSGRIMENYFSPVPQPILLRRGGVKLWIDKYYVAYLERGQVVYAYLTRRHIEEEREALRELARERGSYRALPEEIEKTFAAALAEMKLRGREVLVYESGEKKAAAERGLKRAHNERCGMA